MGGRGYGGGGRGRIYTYRYTVTTRMTCIKMGSEESHFNVSLIVRDKVTRRCPQTTTFEEKGELKRYQTEVHPLTSLLSSSLISSEVTYINSIFAFTYLKCSFPLKHLASVSCVYWHLIMSQRGFFAAYWGYTNF